MLGKMLKNEMLMFLVEENKLDFSAEKVELVYFAL
jgi:hypothetical protein